MSHFDSFLGNKPLISRLRRDIASGHMAHAYIIEGARGCGKKTLSKLIAAAMSCRGEDVPCGKCISCDKIFRDQSPDVISVVPEKGKVQLGVDIIRQVREDAVFAPIDLPKKFYIIAEADAMNDQAQNALLKVLEEPPPHVMFLILSENADELLSTVRSRAPILRVESLCDEDIKASLVNDNDEFRTLYEKDPDAFNAAIKLSRGCLGRAKELLSSGGAGEAYELYKKAEDYMELLSKRKNAEDDRAFYEFAVKLVSTKQRTEFEAVLSLLTDAARDLVNAKLTRDPTPIFYTTPEKAAAMASRFTVMRLIKLTDIFAEAKNSSEHNVNIGLALSETAISAMNSGRG